MMPPPPFTGPVQEALLTIYGRRTPGRGSELLVSRRMPRTDALLAILAAWHGHDVITEIRVVLV